MIVSEKDDISIDKGDLIDIFAAGDAKKVKESAFNSSSKTAELKNDDSKNLPEIQKLDFRKYTFPELILLVNENLTILKSKLKKYVHEKLIDNMLLRSLKKMALQSFLFKNSNWNAEGILRTDWTIDVKRVITNYSNHNNEPEKIEKERKDALFMLMFFSFEYNKSCF